ncbi:MULTISPECIES: alkaline phosphatase [Oceanobacillus]|uniref:Alkaline phosphatase 4 n=1 Tax=Oceanobacillus kimchii TaxID=746691 RepID=A0ABQ5TF36_9BACI|nr:MULTISPECIES: alkaline phosphatase [Oceanobacillus]MBT2599262.1 alkaline phosphatase [Oceanobacillus sp. ISL-74]MBT2652180.1 alkaline phosphatase [Oceanobacillus sp. ISL-73]MCT1578538.1 alkaline phosphatase [Oceanobacillus kimchii]MCT2136413.1 alkaline phosphatase [Oceanobacillus kimchii]OEH54180.1 alkaline phosphatase [Oceanobacillus sp. E9]
MFKKISWISVISLLIFAGIMGASFGNEKDATSAKGKNKKVENVIYMIPDGFSSDYASNYRAYKGEEVVWDSHLKGLFTTHSADSDVTDSAAAGTAMATGEKTNNGVIGKDPDGNNLETILEKTKQHHKATGLVATSTITHATPAAFATHVEDRNNETEIARQLIESEVDVLLGGGMSNFIGEGEGGKQENGELMQKAQDKGYLLAENREEMLEQNIDIKNDEKLLGLFAEEALSPELHRKDTEEPSLEDMTMHAIDQLNQNKKGFFLMVEGSQIDWAGHDNDPAYAMSETEAFEKAVQAAIDFAEEDGETLVVVAADHDTGGMTTGGYDQMDLNANILNDVTATGEYMANQLDEERSNVHEVVNTFTGFKLKEEEIEFIKTAEDPKLAINHVVSERSTIGWTSTGHTAADIPIYAFGPKSESFSGILDNTDIPKLIEEAMKLK